jgi:hypothetical protein
MDNDAKVRENKVRRAVARRRLALVKSRLRDPKAAGYGKYRVEVAAGSDVEAIGFKSPDGLGFTLDELEDRLRW